MVSDACEKKSMKCPNLKINSLIVLVLLTLYERLHQKTQKRIENYFTIHANRVLIWENQALKDYP